jgi:hypothetical protein
MRAISARITGPPIIQNVAIAAAIETARHLI